ncbi:NAD(P)/FAD-dependent oxidoreductase [Abyssalbus ytuae]|uniref:FAD-dependent oxidoreductase n=1 Tax=Abyssalbus ytuae TaxID=2926907 RepID=A0A9E7CUM5_9FLAO|nr:FAD-dependent oxidoreductase [Abyssalbus ytuae]UOB18687.1 FAD-dependent oxidoreductase [Abyssalbus ytuae]
MVDYIIVGLGLAGISFCEVLEQKNKSFIVFDDESQHSSTISGGLYNPVILKRFTGVWKAEEQLELIKPFYNKIENKIGEEVNYKVSVLRRLASVEEQNAWFEAADKPKLQPFISTKLVKNQNEYIDAGYNYGEVLKTGRVNTKNLQKLYRQYLINQGKFLAESFNYSSVTHYPDYVTYKSYKAKKIVFAEGYGIKNNPFFNYLPLNGTKGELLTIYAPALKINFVLKSSVFIMPVGNDFYRIGATYNWKDKTNIPTPEAREELLTKLNTFLRCDYEITDHVAAIRPTVVDRRPIVGMHPQHKNLYILNGLGSRGVMIGPFVANNLYSHIEKGIPLDKEMDIKRFDRKTVR